MKVFLDTNVWLSAAVFSGLCEDILVQCADRGWLVSSHVVRIEAHEVLERKFPQQTEAVKLLDAVWQSAVLIDDVAEPADDNDERLIRAALRAKADYFVTGDKRVLSWMQKPPKSLALEQLRIVLPRDAWNELFGAKPGVR
jgi:putative PIN family toxin of toxin-antitoxin system